MHNMISWIYKDNNNTLYYDKYINQEQKEKHIQKNVLFIVYIVYYTL